MAPGSGVSSVRCAVIINRGSGVMRESWGEPLRAALDQALRLNGWIPQFEIIEGQDVGAVVRRCVQDGVDAVLAGGGDGTTRAVAAELQGTDVAMGVLPFGTLNLAARDLGSPLEPVDAVRALHPGVTRRIDLLHANDETCLCMLVLGFYPTMVSQQPEYHGRNWWLKTWRFAVSLWRSFSLTPKLQIELTLQDGSNRRIRTRFLAVVPGEYQDVLGLVPRRESLSSGHCTVYTSRHRSRWSVLRMAGRYLLGLARYDPDLEILSVNALHLSIRGHRSVPASIDGEIVRLRVPISLRLQPRGLTVLKPERREESVTADPALSGAAS